ncbi:MAG: pyridoxal-phosphate dependent enzyme [Balneolaceae bacterium]
MPERELPIPQFGDIIRARERISNLVRQTPVCFSNGIWEDFGLKVWFKCEQNQHTGSFKYRGVSNTMLSLSDSQLRNGVATHSSGNHAKALAYAARIRGVPAWIVMPEDAPPNKVEAVQALDANITICKPGIAARENALNLVLEQTAAQFIHPYNDPRIVCGQGTATLELMEEVEKLQLLLVPVGGGGLLGGTSIAAKGVSASTQVIGVEPKMADDAYRSLKSGKRVKEHTPNTIADGLRTTLGELSFRCIKKWTDGIVTVSESSILKAQKYLRRREDLKVEASSAVPLAAIIEGYFDKSEHNIGIILSGGNLPDPG